MRSFEEIFRQGIKAIQSNDFAQAESVFDGLAEAVPDHPKVLTALGTVYGRMGKAGVALAILSYACKLLPDDHEPWTNLGATFQGGIHRDIKRQALRRAIEIWPDNAVALSNLAGTYVQDGYPDPGIAYARKAIKLMPDLAAAHNNLALCLMEQGKWKEAWPHFRGHRWSTQVGGYQRNYPCPEWDGREVDSLIIHGEQGLGDEIMCLACIEDVLPRVRKRLVLEVASRLVTLVRRSFPEKIVEVIGEEKEFTGTADAWIALADLPELVCENQVPPRRTDYIQPDLYRQLWWKRQMEALGPPPYVALAHYGGLKHTHEAFRNPAAGDWKPLLDTGATVFSIQYGDKGPERAAQIGVPHLKLAADDLDEQAACIAASDVLVSVAQTALHIGAAMDHPVYGVIGDKPAWRYGLKGSMPWYEDNVTLFRQAKEEPWRLVVERVAKAVEEIYKIKDEAA